MINAYSLPQIFYTMTMAEDKWPQLGTILESTDNNDTLPTNRPLHVYMFYRNYLNNIRNKLWKNPNLVSWGKWEHYFEPILNVMSFRIEEQYIYTASTILKKKFLN